MRPDATRAGTMLPVPSIIVGIWFILIGAIVAISLTIEAFSV